MAVSTVSICKRALHKLGAGNITSLNDNTERARVMREAYDSVRRAELRRHRWRFTLKRASLTALADAPDSDYALAFELPNDFLGLVDGGDLKAPANLDDYSAGGTDFYSLEGRTILCDMPAPLAIRYIADIDDPTIFDSCFVESLAARLAYECVERITESSQKEATLFQGYKDCIREAVRANAIEVAPRQLADDTWIMARLG